MKIGDKVLYQKETYVIEKDYGNQVFLVGNEVAFYDVVPAHMLTLIEET